MAIDRARIWEPYPSPVDADVRPRLAIIERADGRETLCGPDGRLQVGRGRFVLRVLLRNEGSQPLRNAAVNIVVPAPCVIEPFGASGLHRMPPSRSDQVVPGSVVPVNLLAAQRDYAPGRDVRHYAIVMLPAPGRWPIHVIVAGDAPVGWMTRAVVAFTPRG